MKLNFSIIFFAILSISCSNNESHNIKFEVVDTDFSKGRLGFQQTIDLDDLVKFHGHLCDGLVVGALAMQEAMNVFYPNQAIDRTNLRIVSSPSPCLTDVAVYITGGRYQFNTFYVDNDIESIYIIQKKDSKKTIKVSLNKGVKPPAIDSLGALAVNQKLDACEIDYLRALEDDFTDYLFATSSNEIFSLEEIHDFDWNPNFNKAFIKTDIVNKNLQHCH